MTSKPFELLIPEPGAEIIAKLSWEPFTINCGTSRVAKSMAKSGAQKNNAIITRVVFKRKC